MEIVPPEEIPAWLKYPRPYLRLVEMGLVRFDPWYLLDRKLGRLRIIGLKERYPELELFPFAARGDQDDIACWSAREALGSVVIIHDFGSPKVLVRFGSFWDWFRTAIGEMIEHEP